MRDPSRVFVAASATLVCCAALACRGEPYTKSSETVTAPAGSRYTRATASIHFEPQVTGAHSTRSEQVSLKLVLDSGAGPLTLTLDEFMPDPSLAGGKTRPGDTPSALYAQLKAPKFSLVFAPDGHALGLSVDGGKQYRLVALDAPQPLYCSHVTFSLAGGWGGAPKTRDLVLDLLASTNPPSAAHTPHLQPGEHPFGRERFLREFRGAVAYASASPDAEVEKALIAALVKEESPIEYTSDINLLVAQVVALVKHHPELEPELVRAIDSAPSGEDKSRAALALGESKSDTAQAALARALASLPPPCGDTGSSCLDANLVRARLTWALGNVSERIGKLTDAARDALIASSRSAHATIRAHAAHGLAFDGDPRTEARLRALAEEPCQSELPSATAPFRAFDVLTPDPFGPGCWAKAGLARHP